MSENQHSFLVELKRRNVIRVALAYLVVGWLLIQVGDILFEALEIESGNRLLLAMLAIGFLPSVAFAWAFELTPDGLKRERDVDRSQSTTSETARKLDLITIGSVLALMVMLGVDRLLPGDETRPDPPESTAVGAVSDGAVTGGTGQGASNAASIAVLPFADMSEAGDQGYFADGISEEILNVLTRIPGLKVAGRTSSFKFRDNEDLRLIGDQLGVAHVLEGSVRKAGDQARITVQLISAGDGFHLWSQTYDRSLKDIFAVQDEISRAVADRLSLEFGNNTEPVGRGTHDEIALDLYLRGRQALALRSMQSIGQAVSLFESASIIDPQFDAAFSGLARTLSLTWNYGVDHFKLAPTMERARNVAQAALRLNDGNAEAWSVLSYVSLLGFWDWQAADEQNARAVTLGGNDAEIANFVGDYYRFVADFELALQWEQKAVDLDPLLPVNHSDLAWALMVRGECQPALEAARHSLELDPEHVGGWDAMVFSAACAGRHEEVREAIQKASAIGGPLITLPHEALIAFEDGDLVAQERIVEKIEDGIRTGLVMQYMLASHLADMNRLDDAALWLRRAYDLRDPMFLMDTYRVLPADWPDHPGIAEVLAEPELAALYEKRRRNLAGTSFRDR